MSIKRYQFVSLPSTNDWAKEHLEDFDETSLHVICSDEQTAGKGRYGRSWISPKGKNLYLTFVFFTHTNDHPLRFTHLLGLTVAHCFSQLNCTIKWPNDIRCNGKKLAGILCETKSCSKGIGVILGIGININLSNTDAIDQPATSFLLETGKRHSIKSVAETMTTAFQTNLMIYKKSGFTPFLQAFTKIQEPSYQEQPSSLDAPSS